MRRKASLMIPPLLRASHHAALPFLPPTLVQSIHTTSPGKATPLPVTATGPPPPAPVPAASQHGARVDRRRQQAELIKRGQDLRASQSKPSTAMKKRFWQDVSVQIDDGHHIVNLDSRTVRNPTTKGSLQIPPSKPHLATALALEWDSLVSAQQATRSHLIPLTSITSRAQTLASEDAESPHAASSAKGIRYDIINSLLRYLDTDTLLCWAPPSATTGGESGGGGQESLRDLQISTAKPIISYLTQIVWPGIELNPTLDDGSILPKSQPAATRAIIKGWMAGLPAWELVGLERAVLAGKSLCVAARLLCEWSEQMKIHDGSSAHNGRSSRQERFGIDQAVEACSVEVRWQTRQWGEVEDTHDVEKEDLQRQFGSVILLVSGTGTSSTEI